MYMTNMREVCKTRATNPEYALDLVEAIGDEFEKGLDGGVFSPAYVLEKLDTLTRHVRWLEQEAARQWREQNVE